MKIFLLILFSSISIFALGGERFRQDGAKHCCSTCRTFTLNDTSEMYRFPDSVKAITFTLGIDQNKDQFERCVQNVLNKVSSFRNLQQLNIQGVQLDSLPVSLAVLPQLSCLSLELVRFRKAPTAILSLRKLRFLLLNQINLDIDIAKIPSLEILWVQNISGFYKESVFRNQKIERLIFEDSISTTLPDIICKLNNLKVLDLTYTPLIRLPDSIGRMKQLKVLVLIGTQIESLPESIFKIPKLSVTIAGCGYNKFSFSKIIYIMKRKPKNWELNVVEQPY